MPEGEQAVAQAEQPLPEGHRKMTDDERLANATSLYEALAKQGMAMDALPEDVKAQIDGFVTNGTSLEVNLTTPKGHVYCKLQNMVKI